jgi:ribosomal protein L13E
MKKNHGGLETNSMPSKLSTLVSKIPAMPNYKGFSPDELQQAFGRVGNQAKIKESKVRSQYHFDNRRRSSHPENVQLLVSILTQMG